MDLQAIVIGIIAMLLFSVPIFYFSSRQKKEKSKLLGGFKDIANQHQLEITQFELWSSVYAIGLDPVSKKIIYTKKSDHRDLVQIIDLTQVKQVVVSNMGREEGGMKVIDRIDLVFKHNQQPDKVLEFYSSQESVMFNDELMLAEKWKAKIDAAMLADLNKLEALA